jgi:hypothetical protein
MAMHTQNQRDRAGPEKKDFIPGLRYGPARLLPPVYPKTAPGSTFFKLTHYLVSQSWWERLPSGYNDGVARTPPSPFPFPPKRTYYGANIPMRVIRRYARAIADEFRPDKIILFGSYAYGTPHADSDVDLLVVMPTPNQHSQRRPHPLAPGVAVPHSIFSSAPRRRWRGAWRRASRSRRQSCPRGRFSVKKTTEEWVEKAEQDHVPAGSTLRAAPR